MHPEQIKALIRMKGTTPAAIADELELARSTVSQVINGRSTSARICQKISTVVDIPVSQLWPEKEPSGLHRKKRLSATLGQLQGAQA